MTIKLTLSGNISEKLLSLADEFKVSPCKAAERIILEYKRPAEVKRSEEEQEALRLLVACDGDYDAARKLLPAEIRKRVPGFTTRILDGETKRRKEERLRCGRIRQVLYKLERKDKGATRKKT